MPPTALGSRLIVKPDPPDETSDGGLILPDDRDHVPVTGVVVSIGPDGTESNYRARQTAIREALNVVEDAEISYGPSNALAIAREEIARLLGTGAHADVSLGDRVVFPVEAGLAMTVDGEDYVVIQADDVCVILPDEVTA